MEEKKVASLGRHVIADVFDIKIPTKGKLKGILKSAVRACHATLISVEIHTTSDSLSGVAILMESHIAVHINKRIRTAMIDSFVCGDSDPDGAIILLADELEGKLAGMWKMARGNFLSI